MEQLEKSETDLKQRLSRAELANSVDADDAAGQLVALQIEVRGCSSIHSGCVRIPTSVHHLMRLRFACIILQAATAKAAYAKIESEAEKMRAEIAHLKQAATAAPCAPIGTIGADVILLFNQCPEVQRPGSLVYLSRLAGLLSLRPSALSSNSRSKHCRHGLCLTVLMARAI